MTLFQIFHANQQLIAVLRKQYVFYVLTFYEITFLSLFDGSIKCNLTNDIIMKTFELDPLLSKIKTYFYNTYEFGLDVQLTFSKLDTFY